jgi:hypothetical protein
MQIGPIKAAHSVLHENINTFSKGEKNENDKIDDPLWRNANNSGFSFGPNCGGCQRGLRVRHSH